jgi:DNA-binding transcriptional MerR regulator
MAVEVRVMSRTVGEVARLAGVSVRALHHYDELGLLEPSERTTAGYRLYNAADLSALQQILFFKELGFGLDEIGRIMGDPAFDRGDALLLQRRMLTEKAAQLDRMIRAVDAALGAMKRGTVMDEKDMFEVFGDFDPKDHEAEADQRWGDTDSYKESAVRTEAYTKQDWIRMKEEGTANLERMIELFDAGVDPSDQRAMETAESARLQIDRDFYPCTRDMHVNIGEMYVADPRFTDYYDQHRTGLAVWFRDAIKANAGRE